MAYYGITHPDTPNCFWLLGPGTGLGKYHYTVGLLSIMEKETSPPKKKIYIPYIYGIGIYITVDIISGQRGGG
jgi:hypothetical protein